MSSDDQNDPQNIKQRKANEDEENYGDTSDLGHTGSGEPVDIDKEVEQILGKDALNTDDTAEFILSEQIDKDSLESEDNREPELTEAEKKKSPSQQ